MRPERYQLELFVEPAAGQMRGEARVLLVNDSVTAEREVSLLLNRSLEAETAPGLTQEYCAMQDLPSQEVAHVRLELDRALPPGGRTWIEVRYTGGLSDYTASGMSYIRDTIDDEFTILRPDAFAYPVVGPPSHGELWGADLPMFGYSARALVPRDHVVANGG
ncbi:MAG: hypothetical protein GF328_11815, partial [Candidatus Latescibacteria bacterium]|nr:hypothetical protein [Candidatus Latescibacterota bacterium]